MLTVPETAGLDYRKSPRDRSHVFTLPGLCRHYCPWKCASGRPMSAIIVTTFRNAAAKDHVVAIDRRRNRIRIFCPDWMLAERPKLIAPRLCGLLEILARAPEECFPVLAEVSDGEDSGPGLISFCSRHPDALLIPDHQFLLSAGYKEQRAIARRNMTAWDARSDWIVWRGSTNGVGTISKPHLSADDPELLARVRLCLALQDVPKVDAKLTTVTQSSNVALDTERLSKAGICGDYLSPFTWHGFKFAIDIDGNSNAWSNLFVRLLMGCCVLKIGSELGYRQWYYDKIEPWQHYVPVAADLSDLHERISWCRANLDACRQIAARGQEFAMACDVDTEVASAVGRVHDAYERGMLRRIAT
jgi:hypothetical protein